MPNRLPEPAQVLKAMDVYLSLAYSSEPPKSVKNLLASLREWNGDFWEAPVFAKTGEAQAPRCSARLGNQHYPHMKLVLEPAPGGGGYLYRADTHDRHFVPPPGHPEANQLATLRRKNQQLSEEIESAWARIGIPTFKTFLQADLERRKQGKADAAHDSGGGR